MPLPPGFVDELAAAVGESYVLTAAEDLATYDCDGLTGWRAQPACVVLPGSAEEVQAVLRLCAREGIPFVARGAGTGLSGGALPVADGIVVSVARMCRVLEIDLESERVVVEPGVANLDVTRAVAADGYFYAPDPSSQQVCTIGGNVAENSGGAHCLKHGFTVNHVTGAKVVLPDGELLALGGKAIDGDDGPDLLGVVIGSEGTLGIAVEVTLRIVRVPESVVTQLAGFRSIEEAGDAVSRIVAAGILPSAMEIMDRFTIQAAEAAYHPGYPDGAGSVLLVELDGVAAQVEEDVAAVDSICRAAGSFEIRTARDADERALLWKGRKGAFAAMGRVSPDYYVQDGVVPRTKLPSVLRRIDELSAEHGLRVGNVFHAGDGNLHPLVLYDAAVEGDYERAKTLADAILAACVDAGGSLTGEHGIGVDKACAMPSMFSERDLEAFERSAPRVRSRRDREPGQGDPHAAPLRRGPRPVPRPSARAARARGALLMRPETIEEAAALVAEASASGRRLPDRRGPRHGRRSIASLEHEAGRPHVHGRGRHQALGAADEARPGRAAALARPARRPDRRRMPRVSPLGPALAPLRHAARPRPRRHPRPRRRNGRELGRQGGQERRRLRPREARVRLGGTARAHRACLASPPSSPAGAATLVVETDDPPGVVRALRRSQLQPSALDVHHPGRVAVLFEGREGAVAAQMDAARALVGGAPGDASVWEEARGRQARALGRLAFTPGDLGNVLSTLTEAIVRPAAGIAYVPHRVGGVPPAAARRLHRALKARLDPAGVLT